jgi:hypothetical protein
MIEAIILAFSICTFLCSVITLTLLAGDSTIVRKNAYARNMNNEAILENDISPNQSTDESLSDITEEDDKNN